LLLELFVPSPSAVPWAQEPLVFREPPVQLFPAPEAVLNNSERRTEIESLGQMEKRSGSLMGVSRAAGKVFA